MKQILSYIKEALKNSFDIDVNWMKRKYNEYNKIYFNNELPSLDKIDLKYGKLNKNTLGQCAFEKKFFYSKMYMKDNHYLMLSEDLRVIDNIFFFKPYIQLNSILNATENQWEDTFIHEMIHLWTWKDALHPKQAHGKEFKKKCDEIRKKAKEEYGKDYELTIYANNKDEYKIKDELLEKIKKSNRYAGVFGIYIEMNDEVKKTKWPEKYRFLFCKQKYVDPIIKQIMTYEKQYIENIYISEDTYSKMCEEYDEFNIGRTYRYYNGDKYPKAKDIMRTGKNIINESINEEKKTYVKPEMIVYNIPANTNLSDINLEDILNNITDEIGDEVVGSSKNNKNLIDHSK